MKKSEKINKYNNKGEYIAKSILFFTLFIFVLLRYNIPEGSDTYLIGIAIIIFFGSLSFFAWRFIVNLRNFYKQ